VNSLLWTVSCGARAGQVAGSGTARPGARECASAVRRRRAGPWTALAGLLGLGLGGGCLGPSEPPLTETERWAAAERATRTADWELAAELWNELRRESVAAQVRPHVETAAALEQLDSDDDALRILRRAGELFPEDPRVRFALGGLLERMGFRRAAEVDLERATELDPTWIEPQVALGRVRLALAQPSLAVIHLERALGLGGRSVELSTLAARAHRELGDLERSEELYHQAIREADRLPGGASSELLTEAASLQTEPDPADPQCPLLARAVDWATRACTDDPQNAQACFVLGGLLESQGRLELAASSYRRAIEIDNFHLGALTNLSLLCVRQGDLVRARELVARACRLEQDERRRKALLDLVQPDGAQESP
jgi:tetratricopeptide (TPR) repeat protein